MIRFVAAAHDAGRRVDVVLSEHAGVTRTHAQRAVRDGSVTVRGVAVRPSHRLEEGDEVAGTLPPAVFAPPEPEDIPVAVAYEDDRVLVVSKPPGLVVHPARGHRAGTLVNALLGRGGPLAAATSVRPGIVHRLDKDTSGLLLVARDDDARASLVDALRARAVERRYVALVRGRPPAASGTIDAPVGRHPRRRTLMAVVDGGRPSVTHYRVLGETPEAALLEVSLETGRTHQIRVHMSHVGHPVVGDRTYGGGGEPAGRLGLTRPFLHAWRLRFPHPDDGRVVDVADPLPADLVAALDTAGLAVPAP
ncbi:MAG TPA: RluA family pseudouridine synthase [Actinomycetota bacterium]|nr:RluA family pseudouridine synthase [Actinomycetota bacterium]